MPPSTPPSTGRTKRPTGAQIADERDGRAEDIAARAAGEDKIEPIGETAMLNLPYRRTLFGIPVILRDLKIKEARLLQENISEWPDVVVVCALARSLANGGIDYAAAADIWTRSNRNTDSGAVEVSVDHVAEEIGSLVLSVDTWLPKVVEALFLVCRETPDLTIDTLKDAVEENLSPRDLPALLQEIWRVVGGHPGDMRDRFFRLVDKTSETGDTKS